MFKNLVMTIICLAMIVLIYWLMIVKYSFSICDLVAITFGIVAVEAAFCVMVGYLLISTDSKNASSKKK